MAEVRTLEPKVEIHTCAHCGDECGGKPVVREVLPFCCEGCATVYELLHSHELEDYYCLAPSPGRKAKAADYAALDDPMIAERLLDLSQGERAWVRLHLPAIHCTSCIWLLENLYRLHPAIGQSRVDFGAREVRIAFDRSALSLRQLAELLARIGYAPEFSLADSDQDEKKDGQKRRTRRLWLQLGVAGFAFGNTMLLSFPDYLSGEEGPGPEFRLILGVLAAALGLPVLLFSGQDYLTAAWRAARHRYITLDVPIALGIVTLYVVSLGQVVLQTGMGYFDSLSGLLFFLLLGKVFQQRTYRRLSFDRDYAAYFPIATQRIGPGGVVETVPLERIEPGDRLRVRHGELLVADGVLESEAAQIDYSFVTGEAEPVRIEPGDVIRAGGRVVGQAVEVLVEQRVERSQLMQLWKARVFAEKETPGLHSLSDKVSGPFTVAVLAIALLSAGYWLRTDPSRAAEVFTAVLIVACPCALALSVPFSLGNVVRLLGRRGFYAKDASVIERMAQINRVVFDKTGTLTRSDRARVVYEGRRLGDWEKAALSSGLQQSTHPLSQLLWRWLDVPANLAVDSYCEEPGKGWEAVVEGQKLRVGSAEWVGAVPDPKLPEGSRIYLSIEGLPFGAFCLEPEQRVGITGLLGHLKRGYQVALLSGDRASVAAQWRADLGDDMPLCFEQGPQDKLRAVESWQAQGEHVLMVGDGLNDAGALRQADVGVALCETHGQFTPASGAILEADRLVFLDRFLRLAKSARAVVYASFALSLAYNAVGLWFAVSGQLSPIVSAILMPLSSITVVAFAVLTTGLLARQIPLREGAKT